MKRARRIIPNLGACSIATAFIWMETPEGSDYWSRLNDELMDLRWKQVLLNRYEIV